MHSFLLRLHYKIAHRQKNHTLALSYAEQIRAFFETAGDQKGIAESLVLKGNAHYHLSQSANAKQYAHAALEKARQIGDQEIIAAASGLLNMLSAPPAEDIIVTFLLQRGCRWMIISGRSTETKTTHFKQLF